MKTDSEKKPHISLPHGLNSGAVYPEWASPKSVSQLLPSGRATPLPKGMLVILRDLPPWMSFWTGHIADYDG